MARAPSAPCALEVDRLTVSYGGFTALSEASLRVEPGSIVALIGPNGAGKTTCFNAIGGFVRPARGTVRVGGNVVRPGDPLALWSAGVGRTFQRLELFWTLTARQNLELAHHRASRRTNPPPVDEVAELVGVAEVLDELVANLPLGTCRLVELARAACTGATMLLLDEPSSGLDRGETEAFEATVRRIHAERETSVLIVEHDMELVTSLADRVYVLDFGQLIAEGTPAEIREDPAVQQVYLGSAAAPARPRRRATRAPRRAGATRPAVRGPGDSR